MSIITRMGGAVLSAAVLLGSLSATAAAQEKELKEINFLSSLYRSIIYFQYVAAEELGYFEEEGVKVNMLNSSTTVPYAAFLQNGQADIVKLDSAEVINAAGAGIPVSVVYEIMQVGTDAVAVSEDSPLKSMEELKGKTIGLVSDRDSVGLAKMLMPFGLTLEDVKTAVLGEAGPTLANAFRQKTVDAIAGAPTDWLTIQANGVRVRLISPPDMTPGNLFVIDKNRTEELREPIQGFLRAWVKGTAALEVDREAVIAMLKKVVPEEWEKEEFARQYLETAIYVHTPVTELRGDLRPDVWAELQDPLLKLDQITEKVDPAEFLDRSFIDPANDIDLDQIKADIEEWKKNNGM